MDNKVTKQRVNDHLEYDWIKYIAILVASIVVWVFVFTTINANKDWETINFFVTSYSEKENDFPSEAKVKLSQQFGDEKIREISLEIQSPLGKDYSTLLQTHGFISSDILVLTEKQMRGVKFDEDGKEIVGEFDQAYGLFHSFLPMTQELKDIIIPKEMNIEFFENTIDDNFLQVENWGIRIDNLSQIDKIFVLDQPVEEGKEKPPREKFYMVINRASKNIGTFGKKAKAENIQALQCINIFLSTYNG